MYIFRDRARAHTAKNERGAKKDMNDKHQKNTQWNRTYLGNKRKECKT
jgi:hypothetical protein